ncbi:MBL fold metallo-hydrolase [Streptomyces sp. NBC_00247]|uniref:MBL fold metallo-hydrolase n=1 Tax=Streptomyces sp. NBC_00247 TaxID=2975689 RepID=UPI002E2C9E5B|nr:MBL fold metallo-hydrolase [Streptomyces sp. NBC_00247]
MVRHSPVTSCHEVAPGVHRLGDEVVNFYLVEHPDGPVLVDAGLPGHLARLRRCLAAIGLALGDVHAVLLTHAHPDHTGLAAPLREAGARIWVHREDAPILARGPRSAMRLSKPERSLLPYLLRRPSAMGTPLHLARQGAFTAPPVPDPRTFDDDQHLCGVPGGPRAIALPGHTAGTTGFLFADRGLLFTGDALVTHDGMTGHTGPTLVCRGFTHDGEAARASLDRLEGLPPVLLLPGHGDPFAGGADAAVREARRNGLR